MPRDMLSEHEFRLLAYATAYADHCDQHLVPAWIQEQLGFTIDELRDAARGLVRRGLAEFFEWQPEDPGDIPPEFGAGPIPNDFKLTPEGWGYLRR